MNSVLARRLIKWIGYPLFGLFCFVVFLYLTFPFDRIKDRVERQLSASGDMTVKIDELGPSPLLGVNAERVLVVMKPKPKPPPPLAAPGEPPPPPPEKPRPVRILLDEVTVKASLFGLLTGATDVSFDVEGLGGSISGEYWAHKKKGFRMALEAEKLDLGGLPAVEQFVGLPVKGIVSSEVQLSVPQNRWSEATGAVNIECDGCSVGDGKAKLKIPGNPLLAMGITLPRIRLGRFGGQVKIEKGVATFENVSAKSPDIQVDLEGSINLRTPLGFSQSQAYLKFKISPDLKKRDPKFELLENGLGQAKRPDGFFGMRLMGPLRNLRPIPSRVGPAQRSRGGGARPGGKPGYRRFPSQG
jgi:type II secretion system protein N